MFRRNIITVLIAGITVALSYIIFWTSAGVVGNFAGNLLLKLFGEPIRYLYLYEGISLVSLWRLKKLERLKDVCLPLLGINVLLSGIVELCAPASGGGIGYILSNLQILVGQAFATILYLAGLIITLQLTVTYLHADKPNKKRSLTIDETPASIPWLAYWRPEPEAKAKLQPTYRPAGKVNLVDLLQEVTPKYKIPVVIGKDEDGKTIIKDLSASPHMLAAGKSGSGKSVFINSLIYGLIKLRSPDKVKLILMDFKIVELQAYENIPHLLMPVINDLQPAQGALQWAVDEVKRRARILAASGLKDVSQYKGDMPRVVIVIDEFENLTSDDKDKKATDNLVTLARTARFAGIHLVLATQRPDATVVTPKLRANISCRVCFKTSTRVNSQVVLEQDGAEKLTAKGECLYLWDDMDEPVKTQSPYVSDNEIKRLCDEIKAEARATYVSMGNADLQENKYEVAKSAMQEDELLDEIREHVINTQSASARDIRTKFRIRHETAAHYLDILEKEGVVSASEPGKTRKVLVPDPEPLGAEVIQLFH